MDEDIDIEEHDILEHPHIRELFPDFSNVKIEVHGADGVVQESQNIVYEEEEYLEDDPEELAILPDYTPQEYYNITHAVEEPIEISDDSDTEEVDGADSTKIQDEEISNYDKYLSGQYQDGEYQNGQYQNGCDVSPSEQIHVKEEKLDQDLPPEDIYHYNNKIILGTKPCQSLNTRVQDFDYPMDEDDDEEQLQKEYLPTSVALEDWRIHLDNSITYCKECEILFSTQNALDAHKMITHSLLIAVTKNVAKKSTTKSPTARKSTSFAVKTGKGVKNQARKSTGSRVETSVSSTNFCNHCNMQFADHTELIKHLYELLPLKTFNCKLCDAVFNNQKDLMDHNAYHIKIEKTKVKKEKPEALKKKIVFEEDLKKTVKAEPMLVPLSVLFQCAKCKIHFLTITSGYKHYVMKCKGQSKGVSCNICKRKFRSEDEKMHKKQHDMCTKFKVYQARTNLYELTLCKCPNCSVYFNEYSISRHLKLCGKIHTVACHVCDINLPETLYMEHEKRHKNGSNKKDFILIEYGPKNKKRKPEPLTITAKKRKLTPETKIAVKNITKKEPLHIDKKLKKRRSYIDYTVIEYFLCSYCKCCTGVQRRVGHVNKNCLQYIDRRKGRWICNKCGLAFRDTRSTRMHHTMHKMRHFTVHEIRFKDMMTGDPILPCLPVYPQCQKCKIKFNKYSSLNTHTCGENYQTCKICNEKFDLDAYYPHVELHKAMKNKLKNPEKRLLPLKKSEMNSLLYKCDTCDIIYDSYDKAVEHSQNHESSNRKTIKCYICNLKFDETCWAHHSSLHSKETIDSSNFNMLTFRPNALLTEEWLEVFQTVTPSQRKQILKNSLYSIERGVPMKLLKPGKIQYTLYLCSHCQVCCENSDITDHVKAQRCPKQYKTICYQCHLTFQDEKGLQYHNMLHQQGVRSADFRIVNFSKKASGNQTGNKSNKDKYTLYKCRQCGTCISRRYNVFRHKCLSKSKMVQCSTCKEYFYKANAYKHNIHHKMDPNFNRNNIVIEYFGSAKKQTNKSMPSFKTKLGYKKTKAEKNQTISSGARTAKVYKCSCGLHFTSLQSVEKHGESCSPDNTVHAEKCSKCNLLFPTDILVTHLCKHHSINTKITIEEFHKDKVQSTSGMPEKKRSSNSINDFDFKVYKCKVCDIYFLKQNTCYKHSYSLDHKCVDPKNYIECKICTLQFTTKTLPMHVEKHHQGTFSLDRVLVEEYTPPDGVRPLKIDLYKAIDKLQSYQVSSSIDES